VRQSRTADFAVLRFTQIANSLGSTAALVSDGGVLAARGARLLSIEDGFNPSRRSIRVND
jgi:hypothetical protein